MILKNNNMVLGGTSKIEVICRLLGLRVRTKVEPDSDTFTYRGLNKDSDLVFNGSEHLGNQRIKDPFTSLVSMVQLSM